MDAEARPGAAVLRHGPETEDARLPLSSSRIRGGHHRAAWWAIRSRLKNPRDGSGYIAHTPLQISPDKCQWTAPALAYWWTWSESYNGKKETMRMTDNKHKLSHPRHCLHPHLRPSGYFEAGWRSGKLERSRGVGIPRVRSMMTQTQTHRGTNLQNRISNQLDQEERFHPTEIWTQFQFSLKQQAIWCLKL